MSDTPLRLRPPTRTADEALGERLAELARASRPTTIRLRRHRWAAPVAGVALLVASGGVAWGTHAVAHHDRHPVVVPGVLLTPVPSREPAVVAAPSEPASRPERPTSSAIVAGHLDHAHGAAGQHRTSSEDYAQPGREQDDNSDASGDGGTSDDEQASGHDGGATRSPRASSGPTDGPSLAPSDGPTADSTDAAADPSSGGTGSTGSCADPGSSCD